MLGFVAMPMGGEICYLVLQINDGCGSRTLVLGVAYMKNFPLSSARLDGLEHGSNDINMLMSHLCLVLLTTMIVRWSEGLDVIFITFRVLCTSDEHLQYIQVLFAKKSELVS